MSEHDKRVALVTGANKGIGYAICRRLAQKDITVILAARDQTKGKNACARLNQTGLDVHFQLLDVTDEKSIKIAIKTIKTTFGRLDILVNNAGVLLDNETTALDLRLDLLQTTVETNVYGPLLLCQYCVPLMKAGQYGRIVNISSTLGSLSEICDLATSVSGLQTPAYRLSKIALNGITALVAREVKDCNILVNSACPGWVRTDMGGAQAPLSAEEGADTPVWLATLPDGGPNGGFFRERKRIAW
jgi:NAD(P)-dependent dehydrogenase (short-subunit alcohol dehydrogenase family)